MTMRHLPGQEEIQGMLNDLYGCPVEVKQGTAITDMKKTVLTVFAADDGVPMVLCLCDIVFVNKCGAALTLIPPKMAEDNVRTARIPEDILENFKEIVNVLSGLLNKQESKHLKFKEIYLPGQPIPDGLKQIIIQHTEESHYDIGFRNYGSGKFTLIHC